MRSVWVLLCLVMPLAFSGCAYRGKLKSPSQIAVQEEKKQREAEKEQRRAAKQAEQRAKDAAEGSAPPEAK